MGSIKFKTSNTQQLSNSETVIISGKNGFSTQLGVIPVLCTSVSLINSSSNIQLTLSNINLLYDDNYANNLLNVKQVLNSVQVDNFINIPIIQKISGNNSPDLENSTGFTTPYSKYSSNIVSFNLSTNTVVIANPASGGATLYSLLSNTPFYADLNQILDPRYFSNNIAYVTGSTVYIEKTHNISSNTGSVIFDLGVNPRRKEFIKVYKDESLINLSDFTWNNSNLITIPISSDDSYIRTRVQYYTCPAIEVGDNISIGLNNVYGITNSYYSIEDSKYNANLVASHFYKVKLNSVIKSNLVAAYAINVTPDLTGNVGNLNSTSNTFTVDYAESSYPFTYNLANNHLYHIKKYSVAQNFQPVILDKNNKIYGIQPGIYTFRLKNINSYNRSSKIVTKTVEVTDVPLGKVSNLDVTESVMIDTLGGASIRAIVSFDHLSNRDVTDYEISYKVISSSNNDFEDYISVKVSAESVDSTGQIRYNINNLDRGLASGSNQIVVRVTPLNGSLVGIPAFFQDYLLGKVNNFPRPIKNLNINQQGETLQFGWQFDTNADGTIIDLDLEEVEIRYVPYIVNISSQAALLTAFTNGKTLARIPFPNTAYTSPIYFFGTATFILRTRDTSDNFSTLVSGAYLTITRPNTIGVFKVYSEDTPNTNVIVGTLNTNFGENNFPSFTDSNNGGFVYMAEPGGGGTSSLVENSNGAISNFSVAASVNDLSSTVTTSKYYTQIRDVGDTITGTIRVSTNTIQTLNYVWNSLYTTVVTDVTDIQPSSNILMSDSYGGLGTLLGYSNATAATVSYDSYLQTLVSGASGSNVYAIVLSSQFTNDISNSNSYALIAGTINANAIALGATYFANGKATGGNSLANLTTKTSSFKLVNLTQFLDTSSLLTFSGSDRAIIENVFVRTSSSNVFYNPTVVGDPEYNAGFLGSKGNVNTSAFIDGSINNGYKLLVPGDQTFRYFQIQVELLNTATNLVDLKLDSLNYEIDVKKKTFNLDTQINTTAGLLIDYSSTGFVQTPTVSVTMLNSANSYSPIIVTKNKSNCNVKVLASNGTAVATELISLVAQGI